MHIPSSQKIDKEIFRTIFIDHWESFKDRHPVYATSQYENPVQKMLDCGKESAGYSEHRCVYCGGDICRIGFYMKELLCLQYVVDGTNFIHKSSGFIIKR
ncbi:MAG: transposase zinc-binding domain-containing protein [Deltaproteobacteria bacterium]|nr:transposase zinc-binding domain-containing protein [Deltaproteobacteria bacterium]